MYPSQYCEPQSQSGCEAGCLFDSAVSTKLCHGLGSWYCETLGKDSLDIETRSKRSIAWLIVSGIEPSPLALKAKAFSYVDESSCTDSSMN